MSTSSNLPRVSVVIPHFNSPAALERAIRSVSQQTFAAHEVIVVDDASEETFLPEVRRIVTENGNCRLYALSENKGPGTARNLGWDMATGDFVAFLDADDIWHEKKLEVQVGALTDNVNLVAARQIVINPGKPTWPPREHSSQQSVPRKRLLVRNLFPTSSVIVRRSIALRFPPGIRYCEDYDLWIRLIGLSGHCILLADVLSARFKHPVGEGGLSGDVSGMTRAEFAMFGRLRKQGVLGPSETLMAYSILSIRVARRYLLLGLRRMIGLLGQRPSQ